MPSLGMGVENRCHPSSIFSLSTPLKRPVEAGLAGMALYIPENPSLLLNSKTNPPTPPCNYGGVWLRAVLFSIPCGSAIPVSILPVLFRLPIYKAASLSPAYLLSRPIAAAPYFRGDRWLLTSCNRMCYFVTVIRDYGNSS